MALLSDLPERLVSKVKADGACWTWTGAAYKSGYGQVRHGGGTRRVHKVVYMLAVGPVPEGLVLDHLCRNKLCVNPDHLEPVTQAENVRRWARLIRSCPKGHDYTPENTRVSKLGRRDCRECHRQACERYNRKRRTVSR